MKKLITLVTMQIAAMSITALVLAADMPAKAMKVRNFGTREAVTFDHAKHSAAKIECATCHHNAAKGEFKCGTCHGLDAKDKTPSMKEAMHGKEKGVCYPCHVKPDAAQKKKCADCHAG